MTPEQLLAALIDARLFGFEDRESYLIEALGRLGIIVSFASELAMMEARKP